MMDSRLSAPDTSLNAPLADDAGTAERMDFLISDDPLPDEIVGDTIDIERRSVWLKAALGALNARELRIIEQRRLTDEGATLEALGETLGISKERVRQIEAARHGKAEGRAGRAKPRIHGDSRLNLAVLEFYLSVTILTLSPVETAAPGDIALSTLNRSSLRSTPTICAASEPMVCPGLHGDDADMQRLQRRLLGRAEERKRRSPSAPPRSSVVLAEGAAVSSR